MLHGLCRHSPVQDDMLSPPCLRRCPQNPLISISHSYWCAACSLAGKLQHLITLRLAQLLERLLCLQHTCLMCCR